MYIAAGLELYKLTGNAQYLADAKKTADWATTAKTVNGMIHADETGEGDGGLFKGILIRYLAQLARESTLADADKNRYINAIKHNARILNGKGIKRPELLAGPNWSVAPGTVVDWSSHLSGVFLHEAAAVASLPMAYRDVNYMGRYSSLPRGSYTTAQLAARGVANNDITSLTVPPGWTVTMYDGDNFTGTSLVRTTNDTFLSGGAWNDLVSSLVVAGPPLPTNNVVTFYQNCDYTGYSVSLPLGNYDFVAMQEQGIGNDDISSFQLSAGRRVSLFGDAGFAGTSVVSTATDNCLVDNAFNDLTSSLRVESVATATPTNPPRATATATTRPRATATATSRATATATVRPRATATTPAGCAIGAACQAETALLGGGVVVSTLHAGYTGTGFADYQGNGTGYVEWTVSVPSAGTYSLGFRYANGGTGDRPMAIAVNGTTVSSSLSFPVTGWTTWTVRSLSASLPAGSVRIRATELPNGPNVDSLTVTGGATPTPTAAPRATATATSAPRATPTTGGAGAWAPNVSYAVGNLATYGGVTYRCIQAHTSQVGWEPPNTPSLWTLQ
jgi:hypothetical protein